jgi:hypothetical protein
LRSFFANASPAAATGDVGLFDFSDECKAASREPF